MHSFTNFGVHIEKNEKNFVPSEGFEPGILSLRGRRSTAELILRQSGGPQKIQYL